jgi:poly(hydroxyalkanoate) granule-associated protein
MVKKFKAAPDKAAASAAMGFDSQLASAIKDSAQQIWLAGLGAFAKAQGEGTKMFEGLVKDGSGIQKMTRKLAEDKVGDVTGKVTKVAGEITKQATEGWDKLEQVFEDRVARAQKRMGVPTAGELKALTERVAALESKMGIAKPARKSKAVAKAPKKAVAKPAARVAKSARASKTAK